MLVPWIQFRLVGVYTRACSCICEHFQEEQASSYALKRQIPIFVDPDAGSVEKVQ